MSFLNFIIHILHLRHVLLLCVLICEISNVYELNFCVLVTKYQFWYTVLLFSVRVSFCYFVNNG